MISPLSITLRRILSLGFSPSTPRLVLQQRGYTIMQSWRRVPIPRAELDRTSGCQMTAHSLGRECWYQSHQGRYHSVYIVLTLNSSSTPSPTVITMTFYVLDLTLPFLSSTVSQTFFPAPSSSANLPPSLGVPSTF